MSREVVQQPTQNKWGDDEHPGFGMIGASRISATPGAVLFMSDLRHGNVIRVTLKQATRKRDLHTDWLHGSSRDLFEVEMSEAQWAGFVSTMNVGDGVPCTIKRTQEQFVVPEVPFEPRLRESMREVHDASEQAFADICEAMAEVDALDPKAGVKARREAMATLRAKIRNATPNVDYAGKQLAKLAENVVEKARADIEAIVVNKAAQLGIDAAGVGDVLALPAANEEEK